MSQARFLAAIAGLYGALAVALAALGAHAFSELLVGKAALRFDTALRLHLVHAPALLALACALPLLRPRWWLAAASLMAAGTLVFCGGLYLAALGVTEALIPIVPAGGSALILAWLVLAVAAVLGPQRRDPV
jgi:uncharacterized membrane protein YgdD (TMEM256/DUF423 family)